LPERFDRETGASQCQNQKLQPHNLLSEQEGDLNLVGPAELRVTIAGIGKFED
jgi:hypothetical protein